LAPNPGDLLEGRYELLRRWSSGGMGTVWLARVRGAYGFEKLFAIKMLLPQFASDEAFRTMFIDEARIIAQLRHGNVVGLDHLGEHQGMIFLALEWVQGGSWSALIDACHRQKSVPGDVMLRIASGACAGLHAAHDLRSASGALLNVVHRDVSPQNVLITEAGTTKLIDFGIAKARGRISERTQAGLIKAKLEFASPEQVCFRAVDRRADLWGLGVILHLVFAGYLPFDAPNDLHLIAAIAEGRLRPLPPHVPRAVADIIYRALAVDPAARFQTAVELRNAIEAAITTPTSPEAVAACLREFLGTELGMRRQEIRQALEESNRLRQVAATGDKKSVRMPTLPPELSQREWAEAGAPRREHEDAPSVAPSPMEARTGPAAWLVVALATLMLLGVWARVVMLSLEMRAPAAQKTSALLPRGAETP
jgi:serine/threonine-protein kinase